MAEERKVNVMSVEVALKRELAYQKKLARLYPEDDWTAELLTPEVSSSTMMSSSCPSSAHLSWPYSISVLNNRSPFPYSCLNPPSTSSIQSQDPFLCPCSNMEMAKASMHSITKQKSVANSSQCLHNHWPQPIYISNSTNFFCKVCQVNCSGPVSFKQHIRGQKHRAMMQRQQTTRNAGGANACNQLRSNLSNIWYSFEDGSQPNLNGKKQKPKFQEVELSQRGKASQQLWCQLCQVACSHDDTYWLHLKGKNHADNLQALQKNSRGM